jgi:oxygen-independent coproporphyrinogen-3 oxidase
MLNALRLVEGVPRARFAEATGLDDTAIAATVAALVGRGLLRDDPAHLGTTPLGLAFLDDVVGAFFTD